jgi:hypothetical protein
MYGDTLKSAGVLFCFHKNREPRHLTDLALVFGRMRVVSDVLNMKWNQFGEILVLDQISLHSVDGVDDSGR